MPFDRNLIACVGFFASQIRIYNISNPGAILKTITLNSTEKNNQIVSLSNNKLLVIDSNYLLFLVDPTNNWTVLSSWQLTAAKLT